MKALALGDVVIPTNRGVDRDSFEPLRRSTGSRRALNQALFEKILIDAGAVSGAIPTEPFSAVIGHDVVGEGLDVLRALAASRSQASNNDCLGHVAALIGVLSKLTVEQRQVLDVVDQG